MCDRCRALLTKRLGDLAGEGDGLWQVAYRERVASVIEGVPDSSWERIARGDRETMNKNGVGHA